jgi:hypothetical protein
MSKNDYLIPPLVSFWRRYLRNDFILCRHNLRIFSSSDRNRPSLLCVLMRHGRPKVCNCCVTFMWIASKQYFKIIWNPFWFFLIILKSFTLSKLLKIITILKKLTYILVLSQTLLDKVFFMKIGVFNKKQFSKLKHKYCFSLLLDW